MTSMRAAVLVEPKRFEIQSRPMPEPKADEVLVKIERVGICGTDLHIFNGHYAADKLPLVPGHEFVGTVAEAGAQAKRFKAGQRVVVDINIGCGSCYWCRRNEILSCPEMQQIGISRDGAFAEYLVVPARLVIPVPEHMATAVAALTEPVACVVRAARKAKMGLANSVVILGAGPIGNLHVQLMRLLGAAPIIAFELSELRCQMAKEAGADVVISDPAKLHDTVLAMTDGRGADFVIESVGAQSLYADAFKLIRRVVMWPSSASRVRAPRCLLISCRPSCAKTASKARWLAWARICTTPSHFWPMAASTPRVSPKPPMHWTTSSRLLKRCRSARII